MLINEINLIRITVPNQVNTIDECHYVYKYEKPCSYFVILIEGHMILEIGKEKTQLLIKPFDHFGIQALLGGCKTLEQVLNNDPVYKPYIPEFSLKIDYKNYCSDSSKQNDYPTVMYLKIDRNLWLNAINTTRLKRNAQSQTLI